MYNTNKQTLISALTLIRGSAKELTLGQKHNIDKDMQQTAAEWNADD